MFVTLTLAVSLAVFTAMSAYLLGMALVYFIHHVDTAVKTSAKRRRFAVIVPAHNEEAWIADTVRSLKKVDYPEAVREIVVVADNCSDSTAEIARSAGARVLERWDDQRKGKGYALSFALEILKNEPFDAFVVIDADSVVNCEFLSALNVRLEEGCHVVQAFNGIANPDASFITYVFAVGNAIENRLFYEAKGRIGLSAMLRGNGMCLSREVAERFPWEAYSIVEDTEYTVNLLQNGIRIVFAPEAKVLARQPETLAQAQIQRIRWASGSMKMSRLFFLRLVAEGIRKRNPFLADAGLTLVLLNKPLMLLGSLVLFFACVAARHFFSVSAALPVWAALLVAGQILYLAIGVLLEGFGGNRLRYLLVSPLMLVWFFGVNMLGIAGYRGGEWIRTRRSG